MGINKSLLPSGRITNFKPKRSKIPPLTQFIEHGEVSDTETTFQSDTNVKKEEIFAKHFILYIKIHFKAIETFLCTHFSSCHPPGVKRASLNVKHLDSSETAFKTAFSQYKQISSKEGTLKLWFQQLSQKLHLRVENLPCNKNVNKPRETCLLSDNTSTNKEKQWSYPRQQNFRQKNDTMHMYWPFYTVHKPISA